MFRSTFGLSRQGASDLKKGIIAGFFVNISYMVPVSFMLLLVSEMLQPIFKEEIQRTSLWVYLVAVVVMALVIYLTNYIQYRYTFTASYTESASRRIALAEDIRKLPLAFFGKRDLSDLTTTMLGDCTELEHSFANPIPKFFSSLLSITVISLCLFFLDWRMALAVFIPLPIGLILVLGSRKLQDKYREKQFAKKLEVSDGIQEFLESVKELRTSGEGEAYLTELDGKLQGVVKESTNSEMVTGAIVACAQALLKVGFAVVILVGATLLIQNKIQFFTYLVFLFTSSRIYDPLETVFMQITEIFNAQMKIQRGRDIENEIGQTGSTVCEPDGYDISFEGVTFGYQKALILKEVSFVAKQGAITALVGPSGGGKSTAAKLAARFFELNSGRITLGGVDIATVEPETLFKNYSIVFQDVVLFNRSVKENIRIGKVAATDEEVFAAAKAANCHEFILRLPQGYETAIGENGVSLSGGERQRISIARALLKDAPVILLDEATASLDVENETQIQEALGRLTREKTVLIIAHRMRTVLGADKVVVLEQGRVKEEGTPNELLAENGLFAKMVKLQQESLAWEVKK